MAIIADAASYRLLVNSTDVTYDSYITTMLPVIQDVIERYCDRHFDSAVYSTWYRFDCTRKVILQEYPITSILYVGSPVNVVTITIATGDYTIEVKSDRISVYNINNINYASTDYTYATQTTLTALKTEIEDDYPDITVSIVSGYETLNPKLLRPGIGGTWTGSAKVDCHAKIEDVTDRTFKFAEDSYFSYTLDHYFHENLHLIYVAGYTSATMPKALQLVEANIMKDLITASKKKDSLGLYKSETIQHYSYTLGDIDKIRNLVDQYAGIMSDFTKKKI